MKADDWNYLYGKGKKKPEPPPSWEMQVLLAIFFVVMCYGVFVVFGGG